MFSSVLTMTALLLGGDIVAWPYIVMALTKLSDRSVLLALRGW